MSGLTPANGLRTRLISLKLRDFVPVACIRSCQTLRTHSPAWTSILGIPQYFQPQLQFNRHASSSPATHTDLQSFYTHATRTGLSSTSTVYIGTIYEYLCLAALQRFGFSLTRVGGRGDEGIDLIGTWTLPPPRTSTSDPNSNTLPTLPAIIQCKSLKLATGPSLIRELEGALARAKPGSVAVLCAQKAATKGVRDALRNSRAPLVWVQMKQEGAVGEERVRVRQMLWNEAVERAGARGLDVVVKRTGEDDGDGEVVLMWEGEVWEPGVEEEGA